jgi:hypothetical protein
MSEVVDFRIPNGDVIRIKLIDNGDRGVLFEPVSANSNRCHHHAFEDRNRNWNILIRDQDNHNVAAFVLNQQNGRWNQRPLTPAEENR